MQPVVIVTVSQRKREKIRLSIMKWRKFVFEEQSIVFTLKGFKENIKRYLHEGDLGDLKGAKILGWVETCRSPSGKTSAASL